MAFFRSVLFLALTTLITLPGEATEEADLGATLEKLVQIRDWPEVLEKVKETLSKSPDSIVAWQYRAYALHQLSKLADAQTAYERATALDPENSWGYLNLAEVLLRRERWDEAVGSAKRAVLLSPSRSTYEKLSRAHRGRRAYEDAILVVLQALENGVDPGWCHAELGYLTWAVESAKESRDHWNQAMSLGFDEDACAHGLRLADWEEALLEDSRDAENAEGEITKTAGVWEFFVGNVEVHSRIGPHLPGPVEEIILRLQREFGEFLGIKGQWTETVRLDLHRTLEEHEAVRRREFPGGYRGGGFLIQEPLKRYGRRNSFRGPGRDEARKGPYWRLEMHVAYSERGLEQSISHELAHAMLHVRTPRAFNTAVWFDEGLATFLELNHSQKKQLVSGAFRPDLLEAVNAARRDKTLLGWQDMIVAQRRQFEGPLGYTRYAEAWAMVYFLIHNTSSGRSRLRKYISGLESEGRNWIGGFSAVWGSNFDAFDRQFARWLMKAGSK